MPKIRTTQVEFFKICDAARTHREQLIKQATRKEAHSLLVLKTGIKFSEQTMPAVLEATGIVLDTKDNTGAHNYNRRAIIGALVALYESLGLNLPDDLKIVFGSAFGRAYTPPAPPVPVSSVAPATTIPITSNKGKTS